jgi:hypothetical protein
MSGSQEEVEDAKAAVLQDLRDMVKAELLES